MSRYIVLFFIITFIETEAQTSVLMLADSLYANGYYSKAITQYEVYNKPSEVYEKIAKASIAIGNYNQALLNYQESIKAHPNNTLLMYEYAKLLSRTNNLQTAASEFKKLITIDSLNPNYHFEYGLILEKQNDSTAIEEFINTFHLDSLHQKAIYKVAKYKLQKRQFDEVEKLVNTGLGSNQFNVELINIKAQNYFWKQDYHEAIVWFEKLVTLGESSQFIHEKLSLCFAKTYRLPEAIKHGLLALKFEPNNTNNLFVLGRLYEKNKEFGNAESYYTKALEIEDAPLDAQYTQLGRVLNYQKKYAEAIQVLNKARLENPKNDTTAFYLLQSKNAYYEDFDTKINLYQKFIKEFPDSVLKTIAAAQLSQLKQEKFMNTD
ncbi:MAG: tetratricopeptide repeat protein [Xanthomarina gelatinilytica]|uniref:tetratricopeptide repeat protein n=1 Tax=Xanthomarina gelatinilytica TaxID=1137281 RepID=UPI003A888307